MENERSCMPAATVSHIFQISWKYATPVQKIDHGRARLCKNDACLMPCAMANENVKPAQKALLIKMLARGVRLVLMIMEGQRSYACEWAPLDALVSSGTLEETIFKMHTSASYTA